MRVIGTAGHVDHGKSTLVQALTGIDPDRLREEKQRGLTIDLGFAWLTLPTQESVGVVDVPGHIDFIKNMLAGVGSLDAALFVVAADEGMMPQSQEHLDILDLLKVQQGLIAVTKSDLVDDEDWLELVIADVSESVAGTVLESAPIIPVSATTGAGIDTLRHTLSNLLDHSPRRPDKGRPRHFIDRIFTVSGFGTVVTGTLIEGQLHLGQEIEVQPSGLRARIRGLQTHKTQIETAQPGSRVAINLSGLSTDDLQRGDVITSPGWLEPSQLIDTHLRCLPHLTKPLKHNQRVDVFSGSLEMGGHLRLLNQRELKPGESGWVQLRLDERIPIAKGDRFIVRQPSPSLTIAGGHVVDPLPRRRHKRFRPKLIERLETLAHGSPSELLRQTLDQHGPLQLRHLPEKSHLPGESLAQALQDLLTSGDLRAIPASEDLTAINFDKLASVKTVIASAIGWANTVQKLTSTLRQYHQAHPLRTAMPRSELQSQLKLETSLFTKIITQAENEGHLQATNTQIWLTGHQPQLSEAQQTAVDRLLAEFARAPYATPSVKDSLAALNDNEELLAALLDTGQLKRLNADVLILPATYAEFVAWLTAYLSEHHTVSVGEVRDELQTSRKYVLALLEYTDSQTLTRREGEGRVLVNPPAN